MSRTITRKGATARKSAANQAKARKVQAAKAKTGSLVGEALAAVPLSDQQWHRLLLIGILGVTAALAAVVASAAGVPEIVRHQFGQIASSAGFEVHRVEVRGVNRLNELKVYERALAQRDLAMPLVDVDALRDQLLELSWVQDARVSRQLPETLVIDIVERKPFAVLRKPGGGLALIDAAGHELEPISAARAKGKLVLEGKGSAKEIEALTALLDAAPALWPQVGEAQWVGNRRWNLTFRTGQVLALPQGEKEAARALVAFARLDGTNRLLGGEVAAFDMRASDRMYLRIPGRADDVAAAAQLKAAEKAKAKAAAAARTTETTKAENRPKQKPDTPANDRKAEKN